MGLHFAAHACRCDAPCNLRRLLALGFLSRDLLAKLGHPQEVLDEFAFSH